MKRLKLSLFVLLIFVLVSSLASASNFTLNATDFYSNLSVNNFNATFTQGTFTTTKTTNTGLITFPFNGTNYVSQWYLNDVNRSSIGFNYTGYNNSEFWVTPENLSDGDWDTYTYTTYNNPDELTFQYERMGSTAKWTVKDGLGTETVNVPSSCLQDDYVYLKAFSRSVFAGKSSYWGCYTGSAWVGLRQTSTDFDNRNYLYGESLVFDGDLKVKDTNAINDGTLFGKTFKHGTVSGGVQIDGSNHGTVSGGVTIDDGAMVFDGTAGNRVQIGEQGTLDYASQSFYAWIEFNDPLSWRNIFSNRPDGDNHLFLRVRNNDRIQFGYTKNGISIFSITTLELLMSLIVKSPE